MQSNYNKDENHAFVLHESELRKIWKKLEACDKDVKATIQFNDDVERTVDTIEDLVGFENSKKRKILSISINAISKCGENRSRIKFESDSFRTISISSSGNDDLVTKVSDELPEIISGMKPWYSAISRLDVFWLLYAPLSLSWIFASMMNVSSNEDTALTFAQSATIVGILALIALGIYACHKLLTSLKNYLFPVASFAIGQGVQRHETQDKFRFTAVIGFFVSMAASMFFGLLN